MSTSESLIRKLDNNFVMKYPNSREDAERLAEFNAVVHGDPIVAHMTRALFHHHPHTAPKEWPYVEDLTTGEIVSSLCLIPWTWRYDDVTLKSGEMGIVGTLESYRRRGLVRALNDYFTDLLHDGEYDLSQIQGIPYYYRQFGYEYALPLEGGWQIRRDQIPDDLPNAAQGFGFRRSVVEDIPALMRFYDEAMRKLDISAVRDEKIWQFLLEHAEFTQNGAEVWVVTTNNQPSGYFVIARLGFGAGLIVNETSQLSHPAALAVLKQLKSWSSEREKPYIRLSAADTSPLIQAARAWGAQSEGRYAWQIRLPAPARLLRKIAPVLERRIANSAFAGITETIVINLYREAVELVFEGGNLRAVNAVGFRKWEENSINIPPLQFAPLVLGHKSREELLQAFPDLNIWGQSRYLIDVLFPKMSTFLQTIY